METTTKDKKSISSTVNEETTKEFKKAKANEQKYVNMLSVRIEFAKADITYFESEIKRINKQNGK